MNLIQTPADIFSDGALYLRIYIGGFLFLYLYNVCTGIFTSLGDSRTPLYFLIGSSLGNILLDMIFVIVFHWGVAGVAWATFIAQGAACVLALLTAFVIGIPLGYLCVCRKKWERWITGAFQVLRIIPSVAILILLIPVMGTGVRPAMTALVLLAVPPILMNTAAGFSEVPAFMLETAEGLGMTERQMFWKVKVPLAMPMILTGMRTAAIEIIASATIAAKIGAGGLGGIILTGLGLNRTDLLLIGGISVALLSLAAGMVFRLLMKLQPAAA